MCVFGGIEKKNLEKNPCKDKRLEGKNFILKFFFFQTQ